MKYSNKIIEDICEELKKVPNIKYVCKKLGLDRSTFYRWRMRHHFFEQSITDAMYIGRYSINESAESIIINGVQNGDTKCATYWLSHNHERYIAVERVKYHEHLDDIDREFLKSGAPKDALFDHLHSHLYLLEDTYGKEKAKDLIMDLVEAMSAEDPELQQLFFSTYEEYSRKRTEKVRKGLKIQENNRKHFS